MGRITTGIGLVSGINSKDIIDQLMQLESRPKTILQTRIDSANQKKLAYTDLITRLASMKLTGQALKKPSTFAASTAASSDSNVLTATTTNGASTGAFQFQVARLVTSQQSVSKGFADPDSSKVGAGTLTIEMGGGELTSQTPLSQLNGGAGVKRGVFRITDRSGQTATIDTTAAVSLEDVIKKINTSLDISVKASYGKSGLVLTDLTGKTASDLIVQDVGDGTIAKDLGIAKDVTTAQLAGDSIIYLGRDTSLDALNDGRGVRTASSGADFTITAGDGTSFDVTLSTARNVGDVLDAINTAGGGKVKASVAAGSTQIQLQDTSGGGGAFTVAAGANSKASIDLGLAGKTGSGGVISGEPLLAGPGTVLLSSLRGGQGLTLGTISLTDRNGTTKTADLSGAKTVQDVLDAINAAGTTLKASLKSSANGIQLTDTSSGTGNIIIADAGSTTAQQLGIAGTFDTTQPAVLGANLQRQWVSENTLLSSYNGGKGVSQGKFKITAANGVTAVIDLTSGNQIHIKDLLSAINVRAMGVTASINANGDGLLLTDTTGGGSALKIEDVDGTAAKDLNILSTTTTTTSIDGSFEKTLALDANDTAATVQKKINDLGFGATASILNDGSPMAPYRLSLNAINSGRSGRIVFDAGSTGLSMNNLVESQDAAVFVGSADAAQPLLITSSSNQISNVIKGVNIELHGVSDKPVNLGVSRNVDSVAEQLTTFTGNFNDLTDKITELTKWDTTTNTGGLLLGDSTVQQVESNLYQAINAVVPGAGRYRVLGDIGLSIGEDTKLQFDEEKFRQAWGTDPDAVTKLFTQAEKGVGSLLENKLSELTDPVNGSLPLENKTLDGRTQQFQDKMKQLDDQLASKRARLEKQFARMESVLAGLQSQQQALGSMQTMSYSSSSK